MNNYLGPYANAIALCYKHLVSSTFDAIMFRYKAQDKPKHLLADICHQDVNC